jgi:hypothetical protein
MRPKVYQMEKCLLLSVAVMLRTIFTLSQALTIGSLPNRSRRTIVEVAGDSRINWTLIAEKNRVFQLYKITAQFHRFRLMAKKVR